MNENEFEELGTSWHITYHFVWATVRTKACLTEEVKDALEALIAEKIHDLACPDPTIIVLPDRVYIMASAPPTMAPHTLVCQVKAHTSRVLRDEFPELTRIPSLWTRSYLVMAGEALDAEQVLQQFESLLPQRRPRGRPRKQNPATDA